ncbi:MAG: thioesterase family protein [Mycobacterium sp.]|nr:thioesterase family protein [Mycobacterium sp.]
MPRVTYRSPTLSDVVATLLVDQTDDHHYVATQLDNPSHHIAGGHIAGQALVAASRTAPGRSAHSLHVYYLRAGDARHPVDIQVDAARDGGTLATRRITARQDGEVLLEALASFSAPVEALDYQDPIPDVPEPLSVPTMAEQLAAYGDEHGGFWVREQPFDLRYLDPHPRLARDLPEKSSRLRMWWRPTDSVPDDPALHAALLTYLTGTTMLEAAMIPRGALPAYTFSALIDHALWFHRPVDLTDWVLSDQLSPSGIGGRGLASATMYNRAGQLVCVATQELYFGRG